MYEPGGGVLKVSYEIFWTKIKTTTLRKRTKIGLQYRQLL